MIDVRDASSDLLALGGCVSATRPRQSRRLATINDAQAAALRRHRRPAGASGDLFSPSLPAYGQPARRVAEACRGHASPGHASPGRAALVPGRSAPVPGRSVAVHGRSADSGPFQRLVFSSHTDALTAPLFPPRLYIFIMSLQPCLVTRPAHEKCPSSAHFFPPRSAAISSHVPRLV